MTQICAQRHEVATNGKFFPSNSGNKPHRVTAFRGHELPFCSCRAFIFGRSRIAKAEGTDQREVSFVCKHLQATFDQVCDWKQSGPNDYQYKDECPKCGGPIVDDDDVNMVPEDPTLALEDLRSLRAELAGEEPPAPLPRPEPWDPTDLVDTAVSALNDLVIAYNTLPEPVQALTSPEFVRIMTDADMLVNNLQDMLADPQPETPAPKPTKKKAAPKKDASAALDALTAGVKPR